MYEAEAGVANQAPPADVFMADMFMDSGFDDETDPTNPGRIRDDEWWADRAEQMLPAAAVALGDPDWTIDSLNACGAAASMIAWLEYRHIGAMHAQLAAAGKPEANKAGTKLLDVEAQAAARIAMAKGCTQRSAENWLGDALTMRDRLPAVGMMLRAGIISPRQFRLLAARTDLIDGFDWSHEVDAAIANLLYRRKGTWSNKRLGDMCDRIIFRHNPDAVRRRHQEAKDNRSVWVLPEKDGMATLGVSMTGQDVKICLDAINRLVDAVCEHDPHTRDNRRSDAVFALLSGMPFECDCGRDDCAATLPDPRTLMEWVRSEQNQRIAAGGILVHVVAEQSTVDGTDDNPAFMDGHGVISAAHLRDLLNRPETRLRPLNPRTTAAAQAGPADSLPTYQPANPYRPSTACGTFVRIRDGYCTTPGCDRPAWDCDVDHIAEYDHDDPVAGGQTRPDGLGAKCRAHHLIKTHGSGWLDDQWRTPDGRLAAEFISPEGIRFPGPAETNEDLFPSLKTLTWHDPVPAAAASPGVDTDRDRPRPRDRTKAKHARRRREREANRRLRLAEEEQAFATDDPPPF